MKESKEHKKPFFSIITPTYNRGNFLPHTIQSVINQEFQDWEYIIVDDGSTDNTREVLQQFSDSRIKYYHKKPKERSIARNFGIEKSNGEYICFLDSDDSYKNNHLIVLFEEIQKQNKPVGLFCTKIIEKREETLSHRISYEPEAYKHPVFFIWKNFLLINSICVHRKILTIHQFPPEYNVWEDTHLWLRIAAEYPFHQINKATSIWNMHNEGSVSLAFSKVNVNHVENYLECVEDLFTKFNDIISPYLSQSDKEKYQFKKWKMFTELSFRNTQYREFYSLYLFGLRKFKYSDVFQVCHPLMIKKFRSKIGDLKSRL